MLLAGRAATPRLRCGGRAAARLVGASSGFSAEAAAAATWQRQGLLAAAAPRLEADLQLQIISLARLEDGCATETLRLSDACGRDGFFYLVDHGLRREVLDSCLGAARRFFALPAASKIDVHSSKARVYPGTLGLPVRGYVGSMEERLGPYPGDAAETKEAFDWAAELPERGAETPFHGPNLWPPSLPEDAFRTPLETFRDGLLGVGRRLLAQTCVARGLAPGELDAAFTNPTLVCRVLRYPALQAASDIGCNAHTDQGFLTLLHQDEIGGLQVKLRGDTWTDIHPEPGALLVNVGDALAAHTGGRWRSTIHRVLPSATSARFSAALFLDPNADVPMLPRSVRAESAALPQSGPNPSLKVLLHKAGLGCTRHDVGTLSDMPFAEYKLRVFTQFLPDAVAHPNFTDVKA